MSVNIKQIGKRLRFRDSSQTFTCRKCSQYLFLREKISFCQVLCKCRRCIKLFRMILKLCFWGFYLVLCTKAQLQSTCCDTYGLYVVCGDCQSITFNQLPNVETGVTVKLKSSVTTSIQVTKGVIDTLIKASRWQYDHLCPAENVIVISWMKRNMFCRKFFVHYRSVESLIFIISGLDEFTLS